MTARSFGNTSYNFFEFVHILKAAFRVFDEFVYSKNLSFPEIISHFNKPNTNYFWGYIGYGDVL